MDVVVKEEDNKDWIITLEDFPFICRICLRQNDLKLLEEEECLVNLFHAITKIEVRSLEEFSTKVCNDCISKLEDISLFIEIAKNNKTTMELNLAMGEASKSKSVHECLDSYQESVKSSLQGSHICRICLSPSGLTSFEERTHLIQLFQNLMGNNVESNLSVGKVDSICNICIEKLEEISSFISSSIDNYKKLGEIAGRNTPAEIEGCSNPIGTDLSTESDSKLGVIKIINENNLHQSASVLLCKEKHEIIDIKEEIIDSDFSNSTLSNNQYEYTCESCNKTFANHLDFDGHLQEKSYKCEFCERRFRNRKNLSCHQTKKKTNKCVFCDMIFPCSSVLKVHMQTHSGEKRFKCDICEKQYAKNSKLQEHLRSAHTGEKPYKCDYCDKRSSRSSDMIYHVRLHTRDKQLKCNYCDKFFTTSYDRKIHLRTHTGEKPYKCNQCDKSFSRSSHLKSHVHTHTGEKPYKCDYCDKRFTESSHCKRHMGTIHKERSYINVISAKGVL